MALRSESVKYFISCIALACVCFYAQTVSSAETAKQALPHGCNESVCGSVVSKCLLTQSCKCGPDPVRNNITCAKDCFYCLDYLFTECCSCVDVCRKDNREFSLSQKSNVEDLPDPMPELFQLLMESVDSSQGRWTSLSFPAHHTVIGLNKDLHFVSITPLAVGVNGSIESTPTPININPTYDSNAKADDVNCTVAFMKSCLSLNKCRENCMSLGATSYRWFHDGCCECVGSTCLNYGLHEGRCQECPLSKEFLTELEEDDEQTVIQNPDGRPSPPQEVSPTETPSIQVAVSEEPNSVDRIEPFLSKGSLTAPIQDSPTQEVLQQRGPLPSLPGSLARTKPGPLPSTEPLGQLHKADDNSLSV